jgi:phosphate/sulfate permease
MLFAAIIWNLGTWWLGLPASSSHTLIGSIIGVACVGFDIAVRGRPVGLPLLRVPARVIRQV